jgi:hypothetical protein
MDPKFVILSGIDYLIAVWNTAAMFVTDLSISEFAVED